ncbi:MAG: hypothetical protein WCA48_22230 [Pseudomonas gingeri]
MTLTLFWLFLLTVTGFRMAERELVCSPNTLSARHYPAVLYSLLLGSFAAGVTAVALVLAALSAMTLLPAWTHQVASASLTTLQRFVPTAPDNWLMVSLTGVLVISFVTAPLHRKWLTRLQP